MKNGALRLAGYRFRRSWSHRWWDYLALALLVALVGGVALASVAAARRTASSYVTYLDNTNPSDFGVGTAVLNPAAGITSGYNGALVSTIAHLPHVQSVDSQSGVNALQIGPDDTPIQNSWMPISPGNGLGSGGWGFSQDRYTVVAGRLPNPNRVDEIAMLPAGARAFHIHVGQRFRMGIYTNEQTAEPGFGTKAVHPFRTLDARVVGLIVPASIVVVDTVDASNSELAYFTPAFTRQILDCCTNYSFTGVKIAGGTKLTSEVEAEVSAVMTPGAPQAFSITRAENEAKAARTLRPDAIALGAFGAIAGLATLLIAAQLMSRSLRRNARDATLLRMLGAEPRSVTADQVLGLVGAVMVGTVLALAVAAALSPLAPVGPVRPYFPSRGIAVDGTVFGLGGAGLVGFLSLAAIFLAARWSPVRAARRRMATQAPSRLAGAAAASGVPAPAVVGLRFALEPEAGGDVVPVRSAIIGATLALGVLMATVTFGASLDTLVSTPRLYGWNWDAALPSGGDIPQARAAQLLDHDPFVAHWSGYNYGLLAVGGTLTPVLGATPEAAVGPPLLSGHGVERSDEVVLGSITMTALHKHLGDWVTVSSLGGPAARLHIVGRATLPTLGNSGLEHTEMGSGALLDDRLIPESQRNLFANPLAGPQVVFVNFTAGANRAAAERSLGPIAGALSNTSNFGVGVQLTPVYPAEIVNYRTMGTTPALLSGGLAAGAVAALVLTLAASVRRRRREFALLKCLGCTGSQVRAAVACQSSVSVAIGALVGTPLGIVVGRYLWDLFANEIHAVPAPAVPALEIAVIVAAGLVLANVVAALPGRVAARIPAAVLLRAD